MDEWEKKEEVPTHHLFKLAGEMGFLGINKPTGDLCILAKSSQFLRNIITVIVTQSTEGWA